MENPLEADSPSARAGEPAQRRRFLAALRNPLYANAFFVWVNQAGTGLAGFIFWAIAARLYETDDVGRGAAAFGILTLLSMVSTLGLGLAFIRYYPEAGAAGPRLANVVFTSSAVAAAVTAAIFLAGVGLWAPKLDFLRDDPLYALAFVFFVVGGTLSITEVQTFIAIRRGRFILFQVLLIQLSRIALAAAMAGAFGIVAAGGIAYLLGALVSFWHLSRAFPAFRPRLVIDPPEVLRLLPFSLTNYVANFFIIAPALLVPVMVVNVLGPTEGAHFYVAWFIGYLPISFSTSLGTSLFAEGSHAPRALGALSRRAALSAVLIAVAAAVVLLALADQILLAFGSAYANEGATTLRIMALASLPGAIVNVYLGSLRVMKRGRELVLITGLTALATLALSALLVRGMDAEGAAVAAGLGQGLGLVVVLGRVLGAAEGSIAERVRALLAALRPAAQPQSTAGDGHS